MNANPPAFSLPLQTPQAEVVHQQPGLLWVLVQGTAGSPTLVTLECSSTIQWQANGSVGTWWGASRLRWSLAQPLPLVHPLLTLPFAGPGSHSFALTQRELADDGLLSNDLAILGVQQHQRNCLQRAVSALPLSLLLDLLSGRAEQTHATILELVLDSGNAGLFEQLLAAVHPKIGDCTAKELTWGACYRRDLVACQLLQRYGRFRWESYSRHVSEEMTLACLTALRQERPDHFTDVTQLAADLGRLGRFDLLEQLESFVYGWPKVILPLLLQGRWDPDLERLLQRHEPDELARSSYHFANDLADVVSDAADPDSGWRLMSGLPADWRRFVPLAPKLVYCAVLVFAGLTGDVELAQAVISYTELAFISADELATPLLYFQPGVAALPAIEAKLAGTTVRPHGRLPKGATSCRFFDQFGVDHLYLQSVDPANLAALIRRPVSTDILRSCLDEASFAPTLELEPLRAIVHEYLRRLKAGGEQLTESDRWLWRASLRQLLPAEWQQEAERVLRATLAEYLYR